MKKTFRTISVLLTCIIMVVSFVGCGRRDVETIDPNKTQLYVGVYDGGLGYEWLDELKKEYEALNPDIEIVFDPEKDLYSDNTLLTNISTNRQDVYFLNGITYEIYVAQGKLENITDAVTEKYDNGKSIVDKMNDLQKDYYAYGNDKQYYAIPYYDAPFGGVYDVDLFEEKGLYFNTDGDFLQDSSNKVKSAGPDGKTGTYDDGLPATYSEWQELMDYMKFSNGITPYIWCGKDDYYRQRYLTSIWADYEGADNFNLNMSFDGNYTFYGDREPTKISLQNGYLLQKQKGKEYSLNFAKYIIDNGLYYSSAFDSYVTHTVAQHEYLLSATKNSQIAILVEGAWWENESKEFFNTMEKSFGKDYAYKTRRFSYFPVPKADDGTSSQDTTLISTSGNSVVCVNSASSKKDLAKQFIQFCHTESALRTFTQYTGCIRPYDYTLTDDIYNSMSYYSQTMWDLYTDENTTVCYPTLYQNDVILNELNYFNYNWWWNMTTTNNRTYNEPFYAFWQNGTFSVQDYVTGLQKTYSEANWNSKLSKYL